MSLFHVSAQSGGAVSPLCNNKQVKNSKILAPLDFFNHPLKERCRSCITAYEKKTAKAQSQVTPTKVETAESEGAT